MFNNYEIVEYTHSLSLQIQNFTGRTYEKTKVFSYVLLSYRSMQEINQVPTY